MSTSVSEEPVPLFSGCMNIHAYVILLLIEEFAVDLCRYFDAESRLSLVFDQWPMYKKWYISPQNRPLRSGGGVEVYLCSLLTSALDGGG